MTREFMRIGGWRFSNIFLIVMAITMPLTLFVPSPWGELAWGVVAVITIGVLAYAHFSPARWIRVCGYCGKESCHVAHRWTYKRRRR